MWQGSVTVGVVCGSMKKRNQRKDGDKSRSISAEFETPSDLSALLDIEPSPRSGLLKFLPIGTSQRARVDGIFKNSTTALPARLKMRAEFALQNTSERIIKTFVHERATGSFFHFVPLFFGLGISAYFVSPEEPLLSVLLLTTLLLVFAATRMQFHGKFWLVICALTLFFGGMSAGKIRTDMVSTHVLSQRVTGKISGTIIEVSRNQRGSPRYLIKPTTIEDVGQGNLPPYIRLSAASKHTAGKPGDTISGLARLQPISGPGFPGSFDFSFNSWYNGLGGSGFFMGKPTVDASTSPTLSLTTKLAIEINTMRAIITKRIRTALPSESGDIAVALIVGDRTGISRSTQQSLRSSGLAHVLAISGMHMALVSLTMIWAVRFLLALNMRLALTMPIKNWAAIAGFITATAYLAISGLGVATQRAWIMAGVMMLAAVISRKSITLRGVAIAALIILVLQPESVLSPGFQMSFAAVAAIVAAYEWLEERNRSYPDRQRFHPVIRFFTTLIFTSLIAGLATSLFAAYHFHRVAPLGVITNLLAMPLISILVMPMALISVLAMPYGVEQFALIPMGQGLDKVVEISNYVNSLGGSGTSGQLGKAVLPMAFIGLFLLTMLKSRLRILGAIILGLSSFFWAGSPTPDILLSEDGRAIAIRDGENRLAMLYPRRNKFVRDIWLRAFSNDQQGEVAKVGRCDKDLCIAKTQQGAIVYVVYDPKQLKNACQKADILLAPKLRWVNCRSRSPALIIRRGHLEEFGSHAIYLKSTSASRPIITGKEKSAIIHTLSAASDKAKSGHLQNPKSGEGIIPTSAQFEIVKIKRAIITTNRPWNAHRAGRLAYRQDK